MPHPTLFALRFLALGSAFLVCAPALADPGFSGEVDAQVQNNSVFSSDNPDDERSVVFTKIEPTVSYGFTDHLSVQAHMVFEPVQDVDPGKNSYFDNEGLYVQELTVRYDTDRYGFYAGKFNPSFGFMFEQGPSIYGNDFAQDYEVTERLGVGGYYVFGDERTTGLHTLSANLFRADTTFLSRSTITTRGQLHRADGGVSNTSAPLSFSLGLDSEDICGIDGLDTHLSYRNQRPGDSDNGLDSEQGYAAGFTYTRPLTSRLDGLAQFEWAGIRNADGSSDDIDYASSSLTFTLDHSWKFTGAYSQRTTDVSGGDTVRDHLSEVTVGYDFSSGIGVNLGYVTAEEDNVDRQGVGLLMTYEQEF